MHCPPSDLYQPERGWGRSLAANQMAATSGARYCQPQGLALGLSRDPSQAARWNTLLPQVIGPVRMQPRGFSSRWGSVDRLDRPRETASEYDAPRKFIEGK